MILVLLFSVVLLIVVIVILTTRAGTGSSAKEVKAGVAYLESLEAQDPSQVEEGLRAIRQAKLDAERDALIQKVLSGETDVWSMFEDYVILGDSRAVGFYYFDYLDKSRVLAGGGETIANIPDHLEEMKALDPSCIFLCYGLNDVSIGYWNTKEEYVAAMGEAIKNLQAALPNAKIIVSSILPARDPAFERASAWYNIPDYSAAVEAYCRENGIAFANNDKISAEHADLWQTDGIHVRPEFYPYWAANLIAAMLEEP
jgi:hypothetical protein